MTKISAKCKQCRRAGEKLFLKGDRCGTPKCGMIRKPHPPGMHGTKGSRNKSEYALQLAMKQRLKRIYAVMEKQLKKYFQQVKNKPGIAGDLLMQKLGMRLDNAVYRAGLADSRRQARQLIKHSHFLVNGKKASIPSLEVRPGDRIGIKENKLKKNFFKQILPAIGEKKGSGVPNWMQIDFSKAIVEIKNKPTKDDLAPGIDAQMVVEFYSR